jgi:predicted ATP-dependent endonuclease of OLD family
MIKQVRISNYKSLGDVTVKLDPVTILIGRSGSGKTNFVEALRWLRDFLVLRNDQFPWNQLISATAARPVDFSFELTFDAPRLAEDFHYGLRFRQEDPQRPAQFREEKLFLGDRVLYHQQFSPPQQWRWLQQPAVANPPPAGSVMLGALSGLQEATIAHLILTRGIGCYAFPDNVLTSANQGSSTSSTGLTDNGGNFLLVFAAINDNLQTWQHVRDMTASLRRLKTSLKSIDLLMPGRSQILVTHSGDGRPLELELSQESEGFRRLLACLIALYQEPSKQTLIFDEPEKGIYPAGLGILAEEFKGYASKGRGQVLLTTHSPEFLDHFPPENIRVVEMHHYNTRIGPVAPEQMEALREHFLETKELLTVDEARLEGTLAEAQ